MPAPEGGAGGCFGKENAMKTQMKRLRGRRGFTLVECIIAIAVFAAMTMLVFMILTHARNSAVTANEAEEDLTGMISNVVGDDSYKKFYKDSSESLVLQVDNDSSQIFSVSYNKVNGFKNYMVCTNTACPYFLTHDNTPYRANNTEFMFKTNVTPIVPVKPEEFKQDGSCEYRCPECGIRPNLTLRCDDCGKEGAVYNNLADPFEYINGSNGTIGTIGSYVCNECNGTTVMSWDSSKKEYISDQAEKAAVDSDASFQISGLYANAIKYGQVYTPDDPKACFKTVETGGAAKGGAVISGSLTYESNSNHSTPGLYTLEISSIIWPEELKDVDRQLEILFPPYYNFTDVKFDPPSIESNATIPDYSKNVDDVKAADGRTVVIKFPHTTGKISTGFKMYFRLENYKSGFAFEYDYNKSGKQLTNLISEVDGKEIKDNPETEKTQGLFAWFGLTIESDWSKRTQDYLNKASKNISVTTQE